MKNNDDFDYKKIGFKCGLEIHQQLNTKKLFCNCPSEIIDEKPDFIVKRFLRASAGETGVVDKAASAEIKKKKYYLYHAYKKNTCLVELDEEPPHALNEEALNITLQVCKILGAEIVDNVRVMRKIVVDGSNTSGFQRTALVGLGGKVGNVRVETICLEEDAAKIVDKNREFTVYNLSRLGIPLIEIATSPDISSPEEARDIAEAIGLVLRSTGRVKRGLGTIRQDLNISIKGGVRVELKGVQDLKMIPTLARMEVLRQKNLIKIFNDLKKRKARVDNNIVDLTRVFNNTKARVISSALKKRDGVVLGFKLIGFNGFLGLEVQPGRRLGSELADYAKTQGVKGLFHSDELPGYGITEDEIVNVRKSLGVGSDDAFVLIADSRVVAERAISEVVKRASLLSLVEEVRQARPDGTSNYLRPMPGASRMYPETDVPPVKPDIDNIVLPELISDREERFVKDYNISRDLAKQLARKGFDFDYFVNNFNNVNKTFIAELLISIPKELHKRFKIAINDFDDYLMKVELVLEKLDKGLINKQAVIGILADLVSGKSVDWDSFKQLSDDELMVIVKKVVNDNKGAPVGALMGLIMKEVNGRADGKRVMGFLKKSL